MTDKPENPPAFPTLFLDTEAGRQMAKQLGGMYLRDWFAGMALPELIAQGCGFGTSTAQDAYKMADYMLAERGRK